MDVFEWCIFEVVLPTRNSLFVWWWHSCKFVIQQSPDIHTKHICQVIGWHTRTDTSANKSATRREWRFDVSPLIWTFESALVSVPMRQHITFVGLLRDNRYFIVLFVSVSVLVTAPRHSLTHLVLYIHVSCGVLVSLDIKILRLSLSKYSFSQIQLKFDGTL